MIRIVRQRSDSFSASDARRESEEEDNKRKKKFYKMITKIMKILAKGKVPCMKFYVRQLSDEDLDFIIAELRSHGYIVQEKDSLGFLAVYWREEVIPTYTPSSSHRAPSAPMASPQRTSSITPISTEGTLRYPDLSGTSISSSSS